MRLLCLHADTIRALASLHAPFDDLTPDGLWGTDYHLIGVTADQRDVLRNFGIDLEDVTPAQLEGALPSGGMRTAPMGRTPSITPRPLPRVEPLVSREQIRPRESAPPMTREPIREASRPPEPRGDMGGAREQGGGQGGQTMERPGVPQAAAATSAPQASAPTPNAGAGAGQDVSIARSNAPSASGGVATRAPMKLRTRLKGKYREGFVRQGKIHLDGKTFDSPVDASKSLSADKKDWEIWEYYDDDAGKWYMLDREWETA